MIRIAAIFALSLTAPAHGEDLTDQELSAMVSGAGHVLRLAAECQSMFLRNSPVPQGDATVTEVVLNPGQADVTLSVTPGHGETDSTLRVSLWAEPQMRGVDCSGTARLPEGSADNVWGALHRHRNSVAASLTGVDLGPAPTVLQLASCFDHFPAAFAVTTLHIELLQPTDGDALAFTVTGSEDRGGDGCLQRY